MGFWRGKRVLLTGHTGFRGAWLHFWLKQLGAHVQGLSLPPDTEPSLFELLANDGAHPKGIADIRDRLAVQAVVQQAQPEIVFHLAAQPLICAGYREPVETFETNVLGTVHLLDALRGVADLRAVVVSGDKACEDPDYGLPAAGRDALGGLDPCSASRASADIVAASYRHAYFLPRGVGLASARTGTLVGGGDWAAGRLIPDALRALASDKPLEIRRPDAVRPWLHVLEPLHGYMLLAERLWHKPALGPAYNFGPAASSTASVREILELSGDHCDLSRIRWGGGGGDAREVEPIALDSSSASIELGYAPRMSLAETVARTWKWYHGLANGKSAADLCLADLIAFEAGHLDMVHRTGTF